VPLFPINISGNVRYKLKVDSKGRILLPREVREELGDVVILERAEGGFVLRRGSSRDFLEEFKRVMTAEPPRTGEPENWPPSRMKRVWVTTG